MPMSNFPNGFNSGVSIRGVPILSSHSGEVFWVDSNSAYSGDGTFTRPFLTIDTAINNCTANRGSIVMVKAGHAETLATASAITCDIAGVSIIGLGSGADRPTLTFSAVDATVVISAASVTVQNIITKPSIDSVVSPIVVSGADCWLDIEHQDASAAIEAVAAILTTAGADRLHVDLKYRGFIAGNACVNAIRLVGVDTGDINVDFYGVASTSIVEFHTTACHNVTVTGEFYNSGTTDLTKNIVDTVTGSTWTAQGFDGAAGQSFSGGSGASGIAGDDVGAVAAAVAVIDAFHDVPTADVVTNAQMRDVIGNKTDAAVTAVGTTKTLMAYLKGAINWLTVATADAVTNAAAKDVVGNKEDAAVTTIGTTKSLMGYLKGVLTWIGTVTNTGGTATVGAALGDFANDSLAARMNDIGSDVNATTTDSIQGKIGTDTEMADRSLFDILGSGGLASYPAAAAAANDVSMAAVIRYISENQTGRLVSKTYADLTGYDDAAAFTVTGDVMVKIVGVVGATAITSTSGTTTLSIGTTELSTGIIAASTVNNVQFAATDVWVDSTPADDVEIMASAAWHIIGGGADVNLVRSVDDLTAGSLTLYCWWKPLSAGSSVVAA